MKNEHNGSEEERPPSSPDPESAPSNKEEREDRYQNRDQEPMDKEDDDRDDGRYISRSRARNDRPGMWGYKSWENRRIEEASEGTDPNAENENDRGLSKGWENDDGPTSTGKRYDPDAGMDDDR